MEVVVTKEVKTISRDDDGNELVYFRYSVINEENSCRFSIKTLDKEYSVGDRIKIE